MFQRAIIPTGNGGGTENLKYQNFCIRNGDYYTLIGKGDILANFYTMSSPSSYEDDYIKFTITNYNNGTWTIINKQPCTYTLYHNNTTTTTQLAANTTTSCVYTDNAIREFDFN